MLSPSAKAPELGLGNLQTRCMMAGWPSHADCTRESGRRLTDNTTALRNLARQCRYEAASYIIYETILL